MSRANGRLTGKVAIVTGAGSSGPGMGNGKATAILFAREGARVLLADLHEDRARETLATIEEDGGVASTIEVDVTVEEDASRLAETAIERYGRIDVLVNNVGISKRGSVLDVTPEEWDRVMVVNVKSMMLCSRHVVPRMKEGGGGSIINIASTAGLRAHHSTPYTTSKAAVIGLTFSMAADHGPDNIRVNAIAQVWSTRRWSRPGWKRGCGRGGWRRRLSGRRGRDGMWGGRRCSWRATRLGG